MRQVIALALVVLSAAAAPADQLPEGVGTAAPSGSVFTTEITADDCDDYVFQGFPGMPVTAVVKIAKGSALVPDIEVIRPGGTLVRDDEGFALALSAKSATARLVLDATGWWQVRVRGANATAGAYSVSVKYKAPKLLTLPAVSRSFKVAGALAPSGDTDEFAFQGYDGQAFAATLSLPKTSGLDPLILLTRPDGSVLATAGQGTQEAKLEISAPLDMDGTWRLRVVGEEVDPAEPRDDVTTGPYALQVKLGKAPRTGLVPDSNGQYRLVIPAVGRAAVGYALSYSGLPPVFNSFRGPDGRAVPGFPGGVSLKSFVLAPDLPLGDYTLTFDAPQGGPPENLEFAPRLVLPKGTGTRAAKLSSNEPVIRTNGINPTEGGPGTVLAVQVNNVIDENSPSGTPGLLLGHLALSDVELLSDRITVRGTVPDELPEGVFDVVVLSTSGQATARAAAFRRVPPPTVSSIDPSVGPDTGGFEATITGGNFRPGRMGILLDGFLQPVTPTATTETTVTFVAPPRSAGFVVFGVKDLDTQLTANLPINTFEYVSSAAISRVIPSLIPVLGNEIITVQGANFATDDRVYLESAVAGVYQEMTATQTTYVNSKVHQFLAPVRTKGVYRVHVQNYLGQPNPPKTRNLTYYSFADITASTNLGSLGADEYDGWTTALGDFDKDGDQDLFVSRRGDPADEVASESSLTRVLRNDGGNQFADVTASVMPAPGVDDWRADRIWVADVNFDGFADVAITTNAVEVPTAGLSHTRLLVNEQRGGGGATAADRVFRNRTLDIMAPPRPMRKYGYFGGNGSDYIADDWRGLDMWVGDIDKGAAGPPEIVITHDEVKNDDNPNTDVFSSGVYCGNYCSSVGPGNSFYSYTFYWGGSRLFVWDKSARAGLGRYKFDPNFFPRTSGPVVPQVGGPGGISIPACSPHYSSICKAKFTPFTGRRVAVGILDGDGKPDVAVASDQTIQRRYAINGAMTTTSSLQVGINKFNQFDGAGITDLTAEMFNLGGETKGDAVTIGQPGFPDGNVLGVIALTRFASSGSGSVLRLIKFKPGGVTLGTFEDISGAVLLDADANDKLEASRLTFTDIDQDGDQDLVLLARAPPGGTQTAFRILRNERSGNSVGVLRRTLDPLFAAIVTVNEHFEGDALAIGDVTGDGVVDYVVTRETSSGSGSQTRIIKTDK